MKRIIALIMAVAMILTLVPMTALAAGTIAVTPAKTDFYVGESISTSNFTVKYTDDAANTFDVNKDFTINGKSSVSFNKPGVQTLTIAYKDNLGDTVTATVEVKIHAKADYLDVALSDAGAARKTAGFVAGDTVSQADFIVEYFKADATTAEKTLTAAEFTVSPTKLAAGSNTITVSYGSVKGTIVIDGVAAKSEPQLIIQGTPKKIYGLGEAFDPSNLTFIYQPRNSTTKEQEDVTSKLGAELSYTPTDVFSEIGDKTITFTYTDGADTATATVKVTVVGKVNKFEITGSVKQFYAGETFDPTGLTATIYDYENAELTKHVFGIDADSADFTWSNAPLRAGQTSIDITYTHQATGESIKRSVDINVVARLGKLTHEAGDIKTYYVGEEFDPTGLSFKLLYSDPKKDAEWMYGTTLGAYAKLSWPTGVFTKAGTYLLPVTYTDDLTGETVSCELSIIIKDPKAAKINAALATSDLKVVVGDDFDPDQLFEVTFQKANTEGFNKLSYANKDYTVSPAPASFTTEGTQTFTISKDGVSTTVAVEVLPVIKMMTVNGVGNLSIYGGDVFDPDGLSITVYYNQSSLWSAERLEEVYDGTSNGYEAFTFPTDKLLAGTKVIPLTFTDAKTKATTTKDIEITVHKLLKELKVENTASTEFYADEPFSAANLTATLSFNDDQRTAETIDSAELNYDKDELRAGKNQSIVISYTHKDSGETISCEFVFDVKATTYSFDGEVSGPKKKEYSEGEMFDPTGIAWNVKKNTTTPLVISDGFKCYPDRELTPADTSVTVVYGNIAQVYPINVTGRTLVSIAVTQAPDAASFHVGQRFDPEGMIVTATYNNKTTSEVSEFTYDSTPFVETDIGTKEIKLTYKEDGVTAETTYKATIVAAPIRAASLVLSKSTLTLIESKDETVQATVYPATATNKSLIWTSSDTSVARVDQSGKITAVGKGACVISANTTDGSNRYADCYVVVNPKVDVKKLVLKASTMELLVGDSTTLTATIEPENATWNVANWTTSNPDIVTVDANGKITGVKIGSATITASADGVEASITIKVVKELTKYGTVVNCSRRVNVRKSADGGAKQVGYAYLGANYVVTGEEGNWYRIQFNGDTAYIWKDYLEIAEKGYVSDSDKPGETDPESGTTPSTPTIYTTLKVVNCKRYVYVRKGPSTATSKVGHAKPGETYKLLGQNGSWYLIEFNGQQAYISSQFGQLS